MTHLAWLWQHTSSMTKASPLRPTQKPPMDFISPSRMKGEGHLQARRQHRARVRDQREISQVNKTLHGWCLQRNRHAPTAGAWWRWRSLLRCPFSSAVPAALRCLSMDACTSIYTGMHVTSRRRRRRRHPLLAVILTMPACTCRQRWKAAYQPHACFASHTPQFCWQGSARHFPYHFQTVPRFKRFPPLFGANQHTVWRWAPPP